MGVLPDKIPCYGVNDVYGPATGILSRIRAGILILVVSSPNEKNLSIGNCSDDGGGPALSHFGIASPFRPDLPEEIWALGRGHIQGEIVIPTPSFTTGQDDPIAIARFDGTVAVFIDYVSPWRPVHIVLNGLSRQIL